MHGEMQNKTHQILQGDCREVLKSLPDESVHCVVTSPPYMGLRDYGTAKWEGGNVECDHHPSSTPNERGIASSTLYGGKKSTGHKQEGFGAACPRCGAVRIDSQIGLEPTPAEFIAALVEVFTEVRRVLRKDGILWLNLGTSYNGSGKGGNPEGSPHTKQKTNVGSLIDAPTRVEGFKPKDLILIPFFVAEALRQEGWYLRQALPWCKRSSMPESVTDRPANALEYVFMLTKSPRYFYDAEAVRKDGSGYVPGNTTHKQTSAYENGDAKLRTKAGLVAYAERQRDRSFDWSRNGEGGHLDTTPAGSRSFRNTDLFYQSLRRDFYADKNLQEMQPNQTASRLQQVQEDEGRVPEILPELFQQADERMVSEEITRPDFRGTGEAPSSSLHRTTGNSKETPGIPTVRERKGGEPPNLSKEPRILSGTEPKVSADGEIQRLHQDLRKDGERESDLRREERSASSQQKESTNIGESADRPPMEANSSTFPSSMCLLQSGESEPQQGPSNPVESGRPVRIGEYSAGVQVVQLAETHEGCATVDGEQGFRLEPPLRSDIEPGLRSDIWTQSMEPPHGLVGIGDELVGLDVNPAGYKEAHFATYPPKLIEPLIRAATSEKGCCAECGSPWERVVEKEMPPTRVVASAGPYAGHGLLGGNRFDEPIKTTTTGWQPTCKCDTTDTVPCTVLDPFAGAGTTLLVAKRLRRHSIGIELNPEYIKLIERRLEHYHKPSPPPAESTETVLPLFG